MSYIVVYQREDGSSGVEECADLDLAVVTAERLRNVDAVERPRIFQTSEISYDFKAYYRVEVTSNASASNEMPAATKATPAVAKEPATSEKAAAASEKAHESTSDAAGADELSTPSDTPTIASRGGLFGDAEKNAEKNADATPPEIPDVDQLDDEADVVPSRRGLFGR